MFIKFLKLNFVLLFFATFTFAEVITDVKVKDNKRITKETIITFGNIILGSDYQNKDLNNIVKNLYETGFFADVNITINNGTLIVNLVENKIVQTIIFNGVKAKKFMEQISESLVIKEKSPYIETESLKDLNRIKSTLSQSGFYFAKVSSSVVDNSNNTLDLIYDIDLGKKAFISKIEFIGDKVFKDNKLRNIIVSEENKFWKFISNKKYLNQQRIALDTRLLKKFYLDNGFYDVNINHSSAQFIGEGDFKLVFAINSGPLYKINKAELVLPIDYNKKNFEDISELLSELVGTYYSLNKFNKITKKINKISLIEEFQFIKASISEEKINDNLLNVKIEISESKKNYIERINILGNTVTEEQVIRQAFVIDEGDAYNELLQAQSLNNIRSKNIFKSVKSDIKMGSNENLKVIDLTIEEKPTGEISVGAGFGSDGGTLGFSVSENNYLGKGIKLGSSLRLSKNAVKGNVNIYNPNFKYSDKDLVTALFATNEDKLATSGYETSNTGFSFGTSYEQYEDLYFKPSFSTSFEKLKANSTASASIKKQAGNYYDNNLKYTLDYDKRDLGYRTKEGFRSKFTQSLPVISDDTAIKNGYELTKYKTLTPTVTTKTSFFSEAINSISGEDVRLSKRLSLPRQKLKGFKTKEIGPKDKLDYVGGNYIVAINFQTTLPILPSFQNTEFEYFIDTANVWGVDYSSTVNESSKIRSSTGIAVNWYTPIGPLNFSYALPITKKSSDKTEAFQFNLGTNF